MRDTILNQLADFLWRHARFVLVVAAVSAIACAAYSWKFMRLNADTNDLIARDRPFMHDFRALMAEFGDTEYISVVVDSKGNAAEAEAAVDELTQRLHAGGTAGRVCVGGS
jgi:predicted RND superfamily exporter protein